MKAKRQDLKWVVMKSASYVNLLKLLSRILLLLIKIRDECKIKNRNYLTPLF